MNRSEIIKTLSELKPLLKEKFGVVELALFGSYSRDEATDKSDIDIMILLNQPNASAFFNVYDLIQNCFKDKTVQIVSKKAIKPKYFESIKKDLIYA